MPFHKEAVFKSVSVVEITMAVRNPYSSKLHCMKSGQRKLWLCGYVPLVLHGYLWKGTRSGASSQLSWFGHLKKMPSGQLPLELNQAHPTGGRPRSRPRSLCSMAGDREIQTDLLSQQEMWK